MSKPISSSPTSNQVQLGGTSCQPPQQNEATRLFQERVLATITSSNSWHQPFESLKKKIAQSKEGPALVPNRKSLYDFSGADFVESEAIRRSAEDDGNLDKLSRPSTKPGGERCPEKPKDFCGLALVYNLPLDTSTNFQNTEVEESIPLIFSDCQSGLGNEDMTY